MKPQTLESDINAFMLALCIYREAASECFEGRVAVGYTVLTRAQHPRWWGSTIYEVITKPKQYSSMTFLGDLMTIEWPPLEDERFRSCLAIAERVISEALPNPAPLADHYHADTIAAPRWADPAKLVKKIGHHLFYRLEV